MDKLGKTRRDHLKERLTINNIAKFESDLLKINEGTAPQSREFYRRNQRPAVLLIGIASVTHPLGSNFNHLIALRL